MPKDFKYKRIIILGGWGSGKSTLSNLVSSETNYPIYNMDRMIYNSNWVEKDDREKDNILNELFLKKVGIIDGPYKRKQFIENWADLIIFIDTPTIIQLYRVIKRRVIAMLGLEKRIGIPEGAKTNLNFKIIRWVYQWNKNCKEETLSILRSVNDKKILIIKNPKKLDIEKLLEK